MNVINYCLTKFSYAQALDLSYVIFESCRSNISYLMFFIDKGFALMLVWS
jgi:hypothetical protein